MLFSDVVSFTEICSRIAPMEVVSMLNCMYSLFDQLTEKHDVYKASIFLDLVVKKLSNINESVRFFKGIFVAEEVTITLMYHTLKLFKTV